MFGQTGGSKFKPRQRQKSILPLPATFNRIHTLQRKNIPWIALLILFMWYFFNPFSVIAGMYRSSTPNSYPRPHPLTSHNVIETNSRFIYPAIELSPYLKGLPLDRIMKVSRVRDSNFPEIEKTLIKSLNSLDDPDVETQRAKEEAENAISDVSKAINSFKNQDKVVFKPKNPDDYPQVIIVTVIDYERYSLDGMTKLIQNRVDYAHFQNYGTFVRYSQEFLPQLNAQSFLQTREKAKWVRIYCMQAARFAFPKAKWFWFVDQDSLIMDMDINIEQYMLNDDALDPIMMREQPLVPPSGAIKTYKNVRANSIKLIVTQSESMIETTSFVLRNDHVAKSILEIWGNQLYLNYQSFPYGPDSAITHILQWHPFILSKTTIVPAKTIAAAHNFKKKEGSKFTYSEGDFVVQWGDCKAPACEQILNQYDMLVKKPSK